MEEVKKADLKELMPRTVKWIADRRKEWGDEHVRRMQTLAMKGERNCCYVIERVAPDQYRTFGAPFDWNEADARLLSDMMLFGHEFFGVMRPPGEAPYGIAH